MPNHVYGILVITENVGATHASPLPREPRPGSVGAIIGSFKSAATKRINELHDTPGVSVWQRNYYEHVIRNDESLDRMREYLANNPLEWALDRENPDIVGATHASPLPHDEPRRI